MSDMPENLITLWRDELKIIETSKAYTKFIEELDPKLEALNQITPINRSDKNTLLDLLNGGVLLINSVNDASEKRISKEPDPDLKEYIQLASAKRFNKLEALIKDIQSSLTVKLSYTVSVQINPEYLVFEAGVISFNQTLIENEYSISLDSEIRKDAYSKAVELAGKISEFNDFVRGLTKGQYLGIQSFRFSNLNALILLDDGIAEVNPVFIAEL